MKVRELLAITEAGTLVPILNCDGKTIAEDEKEEICKSEYKDCEIAEIFPDAVMLGKDTIPVLVIKIK